MIFIPNLISTIDSGYTNSLPVRIAIVEDEPDLRDAVAEYLCANGYEVMTAGSADVMRELVKTQTFDLAILDIAMPGEDGLSLGRWLRQQTPIGLIYATAAGSPIDRIVGLELGADDYVVKPYELRELLARVRSVLRRVPRPSEVGLGMEKQAGKDHRIIGFGDFKADLDGRMVIGRGGVILDLAKSEFDVLEVFLTRSNRLLSRTAISDAIGLTEESESSRAVDIRIMRLRKKIEDDPSNPKFLRTMRGEGYIFSLPDESAH